MKSALFIFAILSANANRAEAGPIRDFFARFRPQAAPVQRSAQMPQYRRECNGNSCRLVPVK